MRKELYKDIIESLKEVSEVKHIDLWNQNVEFLQEDPAFARPAVFVEFSPVNWQRVTGTKLEWKGTGELKLHLVSDWTGSAAAGSPEMDANLSVFDLAAKIHERIEGLTGDRYRSLTLQQTMTNHNHEEIIENIEIYKVNYMMIL